MIWITTRHIFIYVLARRPRFARRPQNHLLADLQTQDSDAAMANCNNGHWTLIGRQQHEQEWTHTNSITGEDCHHGRTHVAESAAMIPILAAIQRAYRGVSLHGVDCSHSNDGR